MVEQLWRRNEFDLLFDKIEPGFEVRETTLSVEDFMNADEIFQTGNYSKVVPVTRLDDAQFQEGPVTRKALELYMDWARGKSSAE